MATPETTNPPARGKLRAWRERNGFTQGRAGEALHVHQNSVCDWESGKKAPRTFRALIIDVVTGGEVTIEDWLDDAQRAELAKVRAKAQAA